MAMVMTVGWGVVVTHGNAYDGWWGVVVASGKGYDGWVGTQLPPMARVKLYAVAPNGKGYDGRVVAWLLPMATVMTVKAVQKIVSQ